MKPGPPCPVCGEGTWRFRTSKRIGDTSVLRVRKCSVSTCYATSASIVPLADITPRRKRPRTYHQITVLSSSSAIVSKHAEARSA